jgi:hypothetical protein
MLGNYGCQAGRLLVQHGCHRTPGGFQITKFIENSAVRRYDIVQTVEKMSFDRENTSRGSTDYTGFRREFPH